MDFGVILDNTFEACINQNVIIYALAAIGLNVHFGYTGLLNFGQVGFMAAGAYGTGISMTYFGAPLWLGVLCGLLAGGVLAVLLGIPTLRLRADYLAIVTIAAGEIVRLYMRAAVFRDVTGGSNGLNGFANEFQGRNPLPDRLYRIPLGWFDIDFNKQDMWELLVGWTLVGIALLVVYLLMNSPWGRVVKAIREDEDAARALGKNAYAFKMQSLLLGGLFGALAGIFFAVQANSVQPDNYSTPVTFFALTAAILGGLARVASPVLGAMFFWGGMQFIETTLRQAEADNIIPEWIMNSTQVGQVRYIVLGLAMVLLLVFRPQGILGDRREIMFDR
ncbi:MAG: branched-chain amino acid ABC transporter permease [Acidimicrobiales bacterium]